MSGVDQIVEIDVGAEPVFGGDRGENQLAVAHPQFALVRAARLSVFGVVERARCQ